MQLTALFHRYFGICGISIKILRVMQLTSALLLGLCLQTAATGLSQTITFSGKDIPLEKVFTVIKDQTGYFVSYKASQIKNSGPVTVHGENMPVGQFLNQALGKGPLTFSIEETTIFIKWKKEMVAPVSIQPLLTLPPPPADITVSGIVTNSRNEPLERVSVVIKGTQKGTVTDAAGKFQLSVPSGSNVELVFSFVGYATQTVKVGSQSVLNIVMEESVSDLSDVVVVGYGTQSKRNITSAISSVSSKEIQDQPIQQVGQALQGKVPGVQFIQNTGAPGSPLLIRVRGVGTVNNSEPLVVIDGNAGAAMDDLDPNQIESVDVLKSASAAAIYGARGANGVILITTKKGSSGASGINLHINTGIQKIRRMLPLVNATQYATLYNKALVNGGFSPAFDRVDTLGIGTDWQKEIYQVAPISDIQLSTGGGTKNLTYYLTGGYFSQKGIIMNTDYNRANFRINTEYQATSKITIGANVGFSQVKNNTVPMVYDDRALVANSWRMDPSVPVKNPDGSWGYPKFSDTRNPVADLTLIKNYNKNYSLNGIVFVNIDLMKGLTFRSQFNDNIGFENLYNFTPKFDIYPLQRNLVARLTRDISNYTNWSWENTVNYKKRLEHHDLEILGGVTAYANKVENVTAIGENFPSQANTNEDLRYLNLSSTGQVAGGAGEYNMLSYLARVNYSYKNTYLFTGNFRVDGSSKFGAEERYGYFPSFSVGWRLSNENFMKDIAFINDLKIRGGWGELGNQNSLTNYAFANTVTPNFNYTFGQDIVEGQTATSMENPKLQWESTREIEVGIDFTGFENKVTFSADYYNRTTKNMLLRSPIPAYTGVQTPPFVNAGDVSNKGFEILLSYQNSKKNVKSLSYGFSVNLSKNINKILKLSETQDVLYIQITRAKVGEPIGTFYGYVMDGIFQTQAEVEKHAFQSSGTAPGDVRFKDLDDNNEINQDDRGNIGSPWPKLSYGLSANLSWNHFNLSLDFYGVYGNKIAALWKGHTSQANFYNYDVDALNAWDGEGTSNTEPKLSMADLNTNYRFSSYFINDGSYFRLKNAQIGYTFPQSLFKRIQNIKLYFSGQNLLTFTKYRGLDPEIGWGVGTGNPWVVGRDYGYYPKAQTYTLGLNFKF